ncbi:hypothetical protein H6F90_29795 [Trichocoleus sp. FACHB-591]|uniref:hypothetical protein n=1 Tax=Trichocoleus sp. FACHB-591 TaxID=2692872 RepID=UPI0016843838|nr:hypothetical protein [Trichocoleus sp. FACHB-591]MBD2099260.1 hypothetical protein [Trichocoleus sp. FACHB-591]
MTIAPFDPQSIKQDRAVLSRSSIRTAWFVAFALCFLLLPAARVNGTKLPIWFSLSLRVMALVDAGFIYRRVSGQATDERKLTVRVETYDQLEAQKWAALAFMTSQNIKASVLPPMPTREQLAGQSQQQQLPPAQPQATAATAIATTQGAVVVQAQPTVVVEDGLPFPTEDLAHTLTLTTTDPSKAGSVIIPAPVGTGKSNFLRAAIHKAHELHQGRVDMYVFAGKDDETYCGLEKDPNRYMYAADYELAPIAHSRLYALRPRLRKAPGFPTINILEEFNNILDAAELFDDLNKKNKKALPIAKLTNAAIYEQATKGRSKLFTDWITTHSANKEDIALNGAIKRSCYFAVLGRGSKHGAINDALQGRNAIVDDELIRRKLYDQFLEYLNGPKFDNERVLALTNLLGRWRLVFLPHYPDNQPEIRCLIPAEQFSDRPVDISSDEVEDSEEENPYTYRYTEGHERNAALAMTMTQGQCCYPGCTQPATEVHHVRYQDEEGNSICDNPQPAVDLFPLCDGHHQDRSNPECAHHKNNWIKGSCPHPLQIDSRSTDQYILLLKQGWLEKTSQRLAA